MQRAEHDHRRVEIKDAIVSWVIISLMVLSVTAFAAMVIWLYLENNA
jgi:membrane-anchored glycerophosphoryl diester phosphodiesterase (GDPDase)